MLLTNARIITVTGPVIENGYIEISEGKIRRLGKMEESPEIYDQIRISGMTVLPGFVDAHTHLGLCRAGQPYSESDLNSGTDMITPHFSPLDAVIADSYFDDALKAGVTTVAVSPGSSAVMPGQISVMKTYGRKLDDMVIKRYAAQKFAMGENPCQKGLTRMDIAAAIRNGLRKACCVLQGKEPAENDIFLSLIPLLKKEAAAHIHVHTKEDIMTAIDFKREFGIDIVLLHATEGYLISDILAVKNIPVIYGPIMNDRSKQELANMDPSCPAALAKNGVLTALCTDHPETPVQYLQTCAAVAVRNGMNETEAIRAVTINPARILGIDGRVGSIEAGKDADLVVYGGDPLDVRNKPKMVICGGEKVEI